jgi:hypothetical protein
MYVLGAKIVGSSLTKKPKKKTPFGFPRFQGEEGGKENAFANNDPPKHPKKKQ